MKSAPQFQDNLASFGVAYGLGVQGLNRGGLGTNLLPPEIERVRLIRAKKPWALAASALIMLGLTLLFALGDIRVLRQGDHAPVPVRRQPGQERYQAGRGANQDGVRCRQGRWDAKYEEGKALIVDPSDRAFWPQFLKTISGFFPDPEQEYGLDPDAPRSRTRSKSSASISTPSSPCGARTWAEWFTGLDPKFKMLMHPHRRRKTPPTGEGWIVQIVCHHYNPYPDLQPQDQGAASCPRRTADGPTSGPCNSSPIRCSPSSTYPSSGSSASTTSPWPG